MCGAEKERLMMGYGCGYICVTVETYDQLWNCSNSVNVLPRHTFVLIVLASYPSHSSFSLSSHILCLLILWNIYISFFVNEKQYLLEDQQSSSIAILHQFSKANRKLDTNDEEERGGWVTGDWEHGMEVHREICARLESSLKWEVLERIHSYSHLSQPNRKLMQSMELLACSEKDSFIPIYSR